MDKFNYHELNGRPMRIMWVNKSKAVRHKEANIFIKV
jgi:hypothetical protein